VSEHRQLDEAARILSAHGIDAKRYDAVKRERLKLWTAEARAALNEGAPEPDADAVWLRGSVLQLQRNWSGRCISCVHWDTSPIADGTAYGYCPRVTDRETDTLVKAGRVSIETFPVFGCVCWNEIPATESETLQERASLAIERGLLPAKPEGE
jgi:hypothetical protein